MSTAPTADVDTLIDHIDSLSANYPLAIKIIRACEDDDSNAREVARLVELDAAITSRVMRLANSAYFGMGTSVNDISFAIALLGIGTIRAMTAVEVSLRQVATFPEELRHHARMIALAAKTLAPTYHLKPADMSCIGLISCIGEALIWHEDNSYADFLKEVTSKDSSRSARLQAERERYGIDYCTLSATALSKWNFPEMMIETVKGIDYPGAMSAPTVVLRSAVEIARRVHGHSPQAAYTLSQGKYSEADFNRIAKLVNIEARNIAR